MFNSSLSEKMKEKLYDQMIKRQAQEVKDKETKCLDQRRRDKEQR